MTDTKALADRLERRGHDERCRSVLWASVSECDCRYKDDREAARILRDVVPLLDDLPVEHTTESGLGFYDYEDTKLFCHRVQAALDALKEKDDGDSL